MSLESTLRAIDPQAPDYHGARAAIFARFGEAKRAAAERHAARTMARFARYRELDGRFIADDDVSPLVGRWVGDGWQEIDPDDVKSFEDTAGLYFAPEYCHTGDYDSMGSVGEANIRSLEAIGDELDDDPDAREIDEAHPCDEEPYCERSYAYRGAQALVAIRADTDEFLEALEALGDYPLIDEECHGEVELEMQDAAWERFERDETIRAIEEELEIEWTGDDFDAWLADLIIPAPWDAESTCGPWDVLTWENHGTEMHLCGTNRLIETLDRDTLIETGLWTPED